MNQLDQNTIKRRASPIGEVYSIDGTNILGAVYRWNTGEEEVMWDKDMLLPTPPLRTHRMCKINEGRRPITK